MNPLEKILLELAPLTNEQRRNLFAELTEHYCEHCGCKQPEDYRCQCWNDE